MGSFISSVTFENDATGHNGFSAYLREHLNVPIHMIVDAVEEDYRLESMPHSTGRSRAEMVGRKLAQLYRNSTYRTSQFVGREDDKRRDDRFLLMALTNPDIISPWITIIESLSAPLAGIYLRPSVSQLLVKNLKLKSPDVLLTTRQSAGLRQTYFSNQKLRISRLTPLTGMEAHQIDKLYISETEKTRLYLISLRLIGRDAKLHVVMPSVVPINDSIVSQLETGLNVSSEIIGPAELSKKFGLNAELLKKTPDLLHMHVLAKHTPDGNLASSAQTRFYQLHQIRTFINIFSALLVVGATLMSASQLMEERSLQQEQQQLLAQTKQQEVLYDEVSKNFPKTPVSGNDLKVAVELANKLESLRLTPQRLMERVSGGMNDQPEVTLTRLVWKYSENPNISDEVQSGAVTQQVANSLPLTPSPTGLYEIGFIDGEINNFTGDYRAALGSVSRLVESLKKDSAVDQVIVLQQPVNTSSMASLQGSTLDDQARELPAAKFKLKIILKPEVKP